MPRGRVSPFPPRPRRPSLRLSRLVVLDRRVRRRRDRRGARIRGRRRDHLPLHDASSPSARRVPFASSSSAEATSLPAGTATASRRTGSTSSRGSPIQSTSTSYRLDGPRRLVRDSRPRRDARRRLLAGRLDALHRSLGLRQDADGPALHLQWRPSGRTGRAGDAPGAPDPARADRRGVRVVARRGGRRADVPLAGRHVHRRVGLRPARGGRAQRRASCSHRQPHRSPARLRRTRSGSANTCTRSSSASRARE